MNKTNSKMIKITKNSEEFFEKLEIVKNIYNIPTAPGVLLHLMDLAISANNNFTKKDSL